MLAHLLHIIDAEMKTALNESESDRFTLSRPQCSKHLVPTLEQPMRDGVTSRTAEGPADELGIGGFCISPTV